MPGLLRLVSATNTQKRAHSAWPADLGISIWMTSRELTMHGPLMLLTPR